MQLVAVDLAGAGKQPGGIRQVREAAGMDVDRGALPRQPARRPGVVEVTFNRPDKKNAMNPQLHEDMTNALEELRYDDEARVLVITGLAWLPLLARPPCRTSA